MNNFYLILTLLVCGSSLQAQENILTFNAGFEDRDIAWGDLVDDWLYKRWGESTMTSGRNATSARTGNFGVAVTIGSTGGSSVAGMAGIRREVTGLVANSTYRLKFFIKALTDGQQEVIVSIADFQSNPILALKTETLTYEGGAWKELELIFDTNNAASTYSQIRFDIDFRSKVGTYYVDDFSIVTTVVKTAQSITFAELLPKQVGDSAFDLTATATSGLPVSYISSNTSVATISGSTVTIVSDGSTDITASQSGDASFAQAEEVTRVLVVTDPNKASQTINFPEITGKTFGDSAFELTATSSSQLAVSYTALTENVSVNGAEVTILAAGQASIRAEQNGNASFSAASPVTRSFEIAKATQTITVEAIDDKGVNSRSFEVVATTDSNLALEYTITGPATLNGKNISLNGTTGTVTVTVSQAGNDNFNSASATVSFNVVSCDTPGITCFDGKFYVSKTGDDANPGTAEAPFLTIGKAASLMQEGEQCIIKEGIYRESIIPANNNVTFLAAVGEKVVVSAFAEISSWQQHSGAIYKASIPLSLGDQNFVLYNDQIMNLARWPNKTNYNPFDLEAKKVTGTTSAIAEEAIPDQGFENGGVLFFLGYRSWTSWRAMITANSAGSINFNTIPDDWHFAGSHSPAEGGECVLYNSLEALDSNGEWFVNGTTKTLYFQAPDGGNMTGKKVEVRQRTVLLNLNNKQNVQVDGIEFHGGNLNLNGAKNCTISNCDVLYGNHSLGATGTGQKLSFRPGTASIEMNNSSTGNLVERCNIQWGSGSGILLNGSDNLLRNNYIGNFNYGASYEAPIRQSGKNKIVNNAIFNGGRDLINGGGNGAEIGYNDMYASNLTNDDCGAIYMCCGKYGDTRIHHNWIHDISSRNDNYNRYKGCGVYLDNSTEDVIVDHNVMWNLEWSGIQINWAGVNLQLYNNTIWSNDGANSSTMARWVNGYEFTNVPLYNTLANNGELHYTDVSNSVILELQADPFEGLSTRNFMPKLGESAIDGGRVISGFTDGFTGTGPDVGAYERGLPYWIPGPDWQLEGVLKTDCNGDQGGSAFIDKCGSCVGGNTGVAETTGACPIPDCNGDLGGTAFLDKCDQCVEGNTGKTEETGECEVLGLNEQTGFFIYPNPSAERIALQGLDTDYNFVVTELSGRVRMTGSVSPGASEIALGDLCSGVYVLSLKNGQTFKSFTIVKKE